ncbi:MAG: proprotein convertase P-domain-containing protein [Isosphaeraceae bacterium]
MGQTTTFVVRFAPTTRGSKSAVVTFSTNDGDEGSYDITLNAQAQIATISGRVFEDWNGSGVLDPNDVALAGRTVYLDLNNNGSLDYPAIASGPINVSIPDNSPAGVATNLNVSGLAGTVTDVNVTVNITHTWDSDVRLVLRSPTGVLVTLVDGRGGSGDNFTNTTFDDQATTSIAAGSAPFTGSFTPEQPLSAFNGIVPNGTWTLLAYDSVSSDVGVIQNWSLTITTTASDPSTTTDATGAYRFAGLPVGTYTVRSVAPAGWTSVNAQTVIVPDLDTLFPNRDLGQVRQNALYTSEFNDINGDGTRGGAEPGAPGWTVYIDTNNNGALDSTTNTIASGNVNTPIPDNNATGITSTLNVNGLNTPLTDLNVVLNINHTWVGDLNISLKGPNNVTIPLILRRGSSGDNFTGTILDDQAATSITSVTSGNAPFTGSWRPEQPLAGFNGINPNGTWSLLISDVVSSDTGTLLNWSLVITSGEAGQTTDSLGNTRFDNLPAGTHNVRQVDKVGWKPTTPAGGSTGGTLVAGGTVNAAPFGNIADSTAPQVQSIVLVTPSPTNAASVSWTVTFTEPVVGLSLSNFALAVGGLAGTSLSGLSGSGSVYTVSASTGTGSGTLGLNLANASGVKDLAQNPVSNAPFTGQVYTIDRTAPAVVEYRVLFGTKSFDVLSSGRVNLPWQITGIQVLFSEPIAAATLGSLTGIAATGFTGLGTNLLTWSFPAISLGTFNTALLGSTGNAIGDAAGNALGNGSGFARTLKVVYGDVNDDGQVNAADLVLASLATSQPYNIFADANGDGVVDSQDVQLIRRRIGTKLS